MSPLQGINTWKAVAKTSPPGEGGERGIEQSPILETVQTRYLVWGRAPKYRAKTLDDKLPTGI